MALPASRGLDVTSVLRPVREGNAFEETVERLLTVIKLGMIAPGERFPSERELAAQLGVSRLTLREAIRELQRAGFVESRRGRFGGTFVTYIRPVPDEGELRRLAEQYGGKLSDAVAFRFAVETGIAELLAQQLGGHGSFVPPGPAARPATEIRAILVERLEAVNQATLADYRRLDTLFHLSMAELTGYNLLSAAAADARMRLNDLLNAIPLLRLNIAHTNAQHTAIVEAILDGDAARARAAVSEHLEGTALLLHGFLT